MYRLRTYRPAGFVRKRVGYDLDGCWCVFGFSIFNYIFTFYLLTSKSARSVLLVKTQVPYFIVCVVANTAAKGTCKYPHPYLRSAWQARKHFSLNALSRDHSCVTVPHGHQLVHFREFRRAARYVAGMGHSAAGQHRMTASGRHLWRV